MNVRVLFVIINNQVQYLRDSNMDHREWLTSLGFPMEQFESVIRGFIMDRRIVFYKGSQFLCDKEVQDAAIKYGPRIRFDMNDETLEVCCGILVDGIYGNKWEPIIRLSEDDLKRGTIINNENPREIAKLSTVSPDDVGKVIDFKNDFHDEGFIKRATLISGSIFCINLIISIYYFISGKYHFSLFDILLVFCQMTFLGLSTYYYHKKSESGKNYGIAASIFLLLSFQVLSIIIGLLYLVYNIDEAYYIKILSIFKKKKS